MPGADTSGPGCTSFYSSRPGSTFPTANKTVKITRNNNLNADFYLSFSTCFFLQMKAGVNSSLIMRSWKSLCLCFTHASVGI